MNLISIITDLGLRDNFIGVMKAVILNINPHANIVDICHEIRPQDILGAAFLLKGSFKFFSHGTVHLVVVDPGVGSGRQILLVKTENYFFLGPDNGVLSLALEDELPMEIISITCDRYFLKPISNTFHGRDIFAPVAAYVSKGESIENFGSRIKGFKKLGFPKVKISGDRLIGEIVYIDRFGNLVSNIGKDILDNFVKNRRFEICIENKKIERLSSNYTVSRREPGPIALIDSFDFLEIAIGCGSAHDYLGIEIGAKVEVVRISGR